MDDFEDRVRRALQHPSSSADATEILADVHRGVHHRRQRRVAVAAAGVLAVLTATGALSSTSTGPDRSTDAATGPTTSASATAGESPTSAATTTPDPGSRSGTLGFDATPDRRLWTLELAACAHQPCSVLTRGDGTGPGEPVHVFTLDPETPAAADLPPAETVTASDDGRDLWVSGQSLWSSHDAGATWAEQPLPVGEVPQRITVQVVGDDAFALQSHPSRVWRSTVATDDWTEVALPDDVDQAESLTSLGNDLVVAAFAGDRRVVLTRNVSGGGWREADAPCQGEVGTIRSTGSVLMAPCPGDGSFDDAPLVVWRSWEGDMWKPFVGVHHSSYVDDTVPVDDDTVFVVTGEGGLLVNEQGQEQVELPLRKDDTSLGGEFSDPEHGWLLVTSPARLLATEDGGRTWSPVG